MTKRRRSKPLERAALLLGTFLLASNLAGCARSAERWAADLEDGDPFVRALAAIALSDIAPERGPTLVAVLLETVDRVDLELAPQARAALVRIAPYSLEDLVRELLLNEFMTLDRRAALVEALASTGAQGVEVLLAAVRGTGVGRAGDLAQVLAALGAHSVAPLADFLASERDPELQAFAARTLGAIGPRASAAVPRLRAASAHSDPLVRAAAEEALLRIAGAGAPRAAER
ncbi:MAG TPA: HEAT repeat domain-containing protein [Planctomycetota bacterium]|nr:HEAT repeat domain-containing protein [Planctomycetota bacterium]